MALIEYPCRFCDQTPFFGRRYARNPDTDRHEIRLFEGRLQVTPLTMFAYINSPPGVPVMWVHGAPNWITGDKYPASVGRVLTMDFKGKSLVGTIGLSEPDVMQHIPGGIEALDAMVNSGLSVGLQYLDLTPVTWVMAKGTAEKPDKLTYGRVRVVEVSLTPMPRLHTAGLLGPGKRMGDEPKPEDTDDAS